MPTSNDSHELELRISGLLNFLLAYFSFLWKKELHVAAGDLSGTKAIARRTRMVAWMDSNAWGIGVGSAWRGSCAYCGIGATALRTLEDYWYAWKSGGFATLQPKSRRDEGAFRKLSTEVGQWLLSQVSQYPEIPLTVLYERWTKAGQQLPSLRTIYRFLRSKGYDAASLRRGRLQTGPTKAFEAPFVNDLWMADFSPGPKLNLEGRALTSQLCLILDDHSPLIAHGAYYLKADSYGFHQTLKQAVQRRGIPYKLYTDQGGPFTNKHTQIICANLGIRLLHAKPYSAWSKEMVSYCAS